jgi:HK97 family phage portal protein
VGFLDRLFGRTQQLLEYQPSVAFADGDLFTNLTGWGSTTPYIVPETKITRTEALSVPAVLRARNLIAATIGTLPLDLHDKSHNIVPWKLFVQPEVSYPRSFTLTMTAEDLLFEGEAWWRVLEFAWHGYPSRVERIDRGRVNVDTDGKVRIDGHVVPATELIQFVSPNPALLIHGARAIRTLLKLDAAAGRYADEPMALGWFMPAEGADPADDTQIQTALDAWKVARQTRSTGYIPAALKYQQAQMMTAEQLQLAESRQHAVLEIARLTGIDPEDLGVSTTSRTYQNGVQRRLDFLDFTLGPYVTALQERLSMGDVTQRGYYAKFKFEGFLRTDALTRYQTYQLGLAVGAIAENEVRDLEDKPPLTAAQKKAAAPQPTQQPQPTKEVAKNG